MITDILFERFEKAGDKKALIFCDKVLTYTDILTCCNNPLDGVVLLTKDYSDSVFLLNAIKHNCISAVLPEVSADYIKVALRPHELIDYLQDRHLPGLILFSSGTTGEPKAILHDCNKLFSKFSNLGKDLRTLLFFDLDHISGIDTLFYGLFNTSTMIVPVNKTPDHICSLIERHQIEVLPTAPAFLNLLLLDGSYRNYDLSSLKYITYGAEAMSPVLLDMLNDTFPDIKIIQKYGTSETGALRTKSAGNNSLQLKLGDENTRVRIVNDKLEIKTDTSMLGYLNAPSPFTADGWYQTGDLVEEYNGYYRILGRETDVINVGGLKVYPSEVENVIRQIPNVADAIVYGVDNGMMGQIPIVSVELIDKSESLRDFTRKLRDFCLERLEKYKIPMQVLLEDKLKYNVRCKTIRKRAKN